MIQSFADKETEKVFRAVHSSKLPADIQRRAHNKLLTRYACTALDTLRIPPSNHLEALKGNRTGQHSIRINKQWRICFKWENGSTHDVEIIDYH